MTGISPASGNVGSINAGTIDEILRTAVQREDLPGVVAMVATAECIKYSGAFGFSDISGGILATSDDLFFIASMTKAITSVAALQLVEQGLLELDSPLEIVLPELTRVRVLDGFDDLDHAVIRPPRQPMTLRHLLSHTAGFAYPHWNAKAKRYNELYDVPDPLSFKLASLEVPLVHDPGEAWAYGTNVEIVGRAIERVSDMSLDEYFRQNIFVPLGMNSTFYLVPENVTPLISKIYSRGENGSFLVVPMGSNDAPEFFPGGVGLYSTAGDYLTFLRVFLNGGMSGERRIIGAEMIDMMSENQIGSIKIDPMISQIPAWSKDVDLFPGMEKHWGLGFLINTRRSATGRNAGSLTWAGACNSFYWIDRSAGVAGVFMTQVIPFCDERALSVFNEFETTVYTGLSSENV